MDRTILHCDCNSYFASVECISRPELKNVPMAVCGDPGSRHGIILAKNELAKKYGVATAETVWQAKRKCPDLVLVPPHMEQYQLFCKKINAIYCEYTDQVEAFSIDESWLDVTGSLHLFGTGKEIADELRRRAREELGLTISVGVSFNKTFAKLGSDYKKPDATTEITRDNFKDIVWGLPIKDMLFVGRSSAAAMNAVGMKTIGDIAAAGKERMRAILGSMGESLWTNVMGMDDSPVRHYGEYDPPKSISNGRTFPKDLVGMREIKSGLLPLCDSVATRLRQHKLYCTTVQVQIKDPDFKTISRQQRLTAPTSATHEIHRAAVEIVSRSWQEKAPVRLLAVSATGLTEEYVAQMQFIDDDSEKRMRHEKLDGAMDSIRARFGKGAIGIGCGNIIEDDE